MIDLVSWILTYQDFLSIITLVDLCFNYIPNIIDKINAIIEPFSITLKRLKSIFSYNSFNS